LSCVKSDAKLFSLSVCYSALAYWSVYNLL